MNYKEIINFTIMKKGKTQNDLIITSKAIKECLDNNGFINTPIVHNESQLFKDYRDDNIVSSFNKEKCIGFIKGNINYDSNIGIVTATVMLDDNFKNRDCFDNWQIDYDKETDTFKYCACELFHM